MTDIPGLHATGRKPKDVKVRIFSNPKLPDHQQMDGSRTLTFNTDQDLDGVRDSLEDMINRFGPAYSEDIEWVDQADLIKGTETSQVHAWDAAMLMLEEVRDEDHDSVDDALDDLQRRLQRSLKDSVNTITGE